MYTIRYILAVMVIAGSTMMDDKVFAMGLEIQDKHRRHHHDRVSPTHRIERREPTVSTPSLRDIYRSIDGTGNNLFDDETGAAHTPLVRLAPPDYADGIKSLGGSNRLSARVISNIVHDQSDSYPNNKKVSSFIWQWGQFIDHDLDLTDGVDPPEPASIQVPEDDPYFDPDGTGAELIPFNRSIYDRNSGTSVLNPRQQINEITAWIDASNVYGSDSERAADLRTNDGSGRLRTSAGNLLPYNTNGLPNAGGSGADLFLAGDVRANEQIALTAMHTLFMREHNRLADEISQADPELGGDEIFERARRIVGAQLQVITYREFIPALMGPDALAPYQGYRPEVDAGIANVFATAAFRWGHSALNERILRLDKRKKEIDQGHLELLDAFFSPQLITDEGGIDPILRGLAHQYAQAIDIYIVDDVRNFLFGAPGEGGFDLAALNIQRGRDHGLAGYNQMLEAFGMPRKQSFDAISKDPIVRERLAAAYADVDDVDATVGCLAEDALPGALIGELAYMALKVQFEALRDGDRFWYQWALTPDEIETLEDTRLSDIIRRNTDIGREIRNDVFRVYENKRSRHGHGHRHRHR